jgi:2-haloacid dehalogenase
MITTRYRVFPDAVSFQSSNRWDAAGAAAFGFRTVWVNRNGLPDEYAEFKPAAVLPNLNGLLALG